MLFPSAPSPAQNLLSSLDVLEQILFQACLNSDALGPPRTLHPLSLTCRHFAAFFSISSNPTFFDRLFISSFGINPQRFSSPPGDTKVFVREFWVVLKKFRDVHRNRLCLSDLGISDWFLVSNFISLVTVMDRQAFRQLTLYAHVNEASRALLLDSLHKATGRCEPATWLAMGIWWATQISALVDMPPHEDRHDADLAKVLEAFAFSECTEPHVYSPPYVKPLEVIKRPFNDVPIRANNFLPILCILRITCHGPACPCCKQVRKAIGCVDAYQRSPTRSCVGASSDGGTTVSGLWLGRMLFQCKMLMEGETEANNVPPETVLVQKQLHWRIHTHCPVDVFAPCAKCPLYLAIQPLDANTAPLYHSIWERYYVQKWTLLVGTVDEELHNQWDPDALLPAYIGVVDFDSGKVTLVRDDGPDGVWIYEGNIFELDIGANGSLPAWFGRCTNGDGNIKAVFGLIKCDE